MLAGHAPAPLDDTLHFCVSVLFYLQDEELDFITLEGRYLQSV